MGRLGGNQHTRTLVWLCAAASADRQTQPFLECYKSSNLCNGTPKELLPPRFRFNLEESLGRFHSFQPMNATWLRTAGKTRRGVGPWIEEGLAGGRCTPRQIKSVPSLPAFNFPRASQILPLRWYPYGCTPVIRAGCMQIPVLRSVFVLVLFFF